MQYPCRVYLKTPNPFDHTQVVCHNRIVSIEGDGPLLYNDDDLIRLAPIGAYLRFEPVETQVEESVSGVEEAQPEGVSAGQEENQDPSGDEVAVQDMSAAQLRKYILSHFEDQKADALKPLKKDDLLWLVQELQAKETVETVDIVAQ